ncbi:MAG: hypothetical protein E7256_04560 [Lachnospiraceae bacterium]|nr:hypothetical protein [Lachnospiraceae bacterium]
MGYEENSQSSDEIFICPEPEYTNDMSNGYDQTLRGCYYKGSCEPLFLTIGERAYFILENPKNSGVDVFVNRGIYMNASPAPILVNLYLTAHVKGEIGCCRDVNNANTYFEKKDAGARILGGRNLLLKGGEANTRFALAAYTTHVIDVNGSILLAPGKCLVVEMASLIPEMNASVVSSFAWWECRTEESECE